MSFTGAKIEGLENLADAALDILKGEELEEKKLDPVDQKAVDKDFDDRKDKDIDNDGDVDDSDEYLHKRRQAISKAIEDEEDEEKVDEAKKADEVSYHPLTAEGEVAEVDPKNHLDQEDVEKKDGEEEEAEEPEVVESTYVDYVIEAIEVREGKMKELHALVSKGVKDPKKIAKALRLHQTPEVHDAIKKIIAGM